MLEPRLTRARDEAGKRAMPSEDEMQPPFVGRLATVLVADVVGYTARMERNARATLTALFECRTLITDLVVSAGGAVVDTPGDFLLALLPGPNEALESAIAVQAALRDRNRNCEDAYRAEYRIGIGLGHVFDHGGDVLGEAVNVASRLQALAPPGGIVISGPVRERVVSTSPLRFQDLGERPLHNMAAPVRAFLVMGEGGEASPDRLEGEGHGSGEPLPIRPIVEVEAFKPLTGTEHEVRFAEGLVEEIIGILAALSGSITVRQVTTAAQAMPHAPRRGDVPRIYRLSGTVRRTSEEVRILSRLTTAQTGEAIWAERFHYERDQAFNAQEVIAHDVVQTIQGMLTEGQQIALWRKATSSLRAWEWFQQGHDLEHRFTRRTHAEARRCYARALELDPDYVSAITALAFCHLDEIRLGWSDDVAGSFDAARTLHHRAVAIDPSGPSVHALLAYLRLHESRDEEAVEAMERAVALAPQSGEIAGYLGYLYETLGRWQDALAAYRRAMRLSTHFPAWIAANFGFAMCNVGQVHEARRAFLGVTANHPDYVRAYLGLVIVCNRLGQREEAARAVAEVRRLDPLFAVDQWARNRPYADPAIVAALCADMRSAGLT
jgi:class 3 adenylate cyclase/TolB-like protein/Tfp pilus assembly protein PilF